MAEPDSAIKGRRRREQKRKYGRSAKVLCHLNASWENRFGYIERKLSFQIVIYFNINSMRMCSTVCMRCVCIHLYGVWCIQNINKIQINTSTFACSRALTYNGKIHTQKRDGGKTQIICIHDINTILILLTSIIW